MRQGGSRGSDSGELAPPAHRTCLIALSQTMADDKQTSKLRATSISSRADEAVVPPHPSTSSMNSVPTVRTYSTRLT